MNLFLIESKTEMKFCLKKKIKYEPEVSGRIWWHHQTFVTALIFGNGHWRRWQRHLVIQELFPSFFSL